MTQFSSQQSQEDNVFFHTLLCFPLTSFYMPACSSPSLNTGTYPFNAIIPKILSGQFHHADPPQHSTHAIPMWHLCSFVDIKYPSKCGCYFSSKLEVSFFHLVTNDKYSTGHNGRVYFQKYMSGLKYCLNMTTVHNRFLINCSIKTVCVSCLAKDNGSFMSQFQLMPASTTVSQAVYAK